MDQLSLQDFDDELARRIEALARVEHVSLNEAALLLLRRGAGLLEPAPAAPVGETLDRFIGCWSAADEKELLRSIAPCETVDEALWK